MKSSVACGCMVLFLAPTAGCASRPESETQRIVARLEFVMNTGCGGALEFDESNPTRPVIGVKLDNASILDAGLRLVGKLKTVRTLSLAEAVHFSDRGLGFLRGLSSLESLDLRATGISDDALYHVGALTSLQHLDLSGNYLVSDTGLTYLRGLTNLQQLTLSETAVTAAGVADLKACLANVAIVR
jgi:hypothetical protein